MNARLISNLAATALCEASNQIAASAEKTPEKPVFYCEELDSFVGEDGRKYVVEITVRPETD
jgi:hypothetical protein